jgi:catechol 2,3-dioxygenase-like lactoylglutathione lyase family enzyme
LRSSFVLDIDAFIDGEDGMIGYVTLGTNDLERAAKFYDLLCAELGVGRMFEWPNAIAWGQEGGGAGIGLTKPFNGEPATVGNGVMVALECRDEAQVHRLYEVALANGGTCEGPPGPRGGGFYAGYFRDPDGNKLNAFIMGAPEAAQSEPAEASSGG